MDDSPESFHQAAKQKPVSLGREIFEMLLLVGLLLLLGTTGAAPFIYTLF